MAELIAALPCLDPDVDGAQRIERIRALEELKAAVAAAQAVETVALLAARRAAAAAPVKAADVERDVAAQIGLARRISPARARRELDWALVLTADLPATFAALQGGRISEWHAQLVARETAWLSPRDRRGVDAGLAPRLGSFGAARLEAEARRLAYRADPVGFLARIRGAEADRSVSCRPAPVAMARLSALAPVAAGVAGYASLAAMPRRCAPPVTRARGLS